MKTGTLRFYANVESYVVGSTGDRGQQTGSWIALYSNVPMDIENLNGRQLELAKQLVATATHRITMRYLSGISPTMRVNYEGRIFGIDSIDEGDFRERYLKFICTEQQVGAA